MSGQDREHSTYSPSQAERFFACPGSVQALAKLPARETSEYAILGTQAHDVLDAALQNGIRDARIAHSEHSLYCFETFTPDFFRSIQIALDYIYTILDEHPDAILYHERKVHVPLPAAPGEADGYCDVGIYIPSIRKLIVIDYKHGEGVAKSAKGNKQLLQYSAGFLNGNVDPGTVDDVEMVILQPRAFHEHGPIREWTVAPIDIVMHLEDLNDAVLECMKPNAPLIPGPHCDETFCDNRTTCPARESRALAVAREAFANISMPKDVVAPEVHSIDIQRLSYIAQNAPVLKKFLDDVEQHLHELLRQGIPVPGLKLVEVEARRTWYGEVMDVAWKLVELADVPIDEVVVTKLIGITDAEKLVIANYRKNAGDTKAEKNKASEEARKAMAELTLKKSSGNLTVVPMDDPRQPVDGRNAFAQIADAVRTTEK